MVLALMVKLPLLVSKTVGVDALATLTLARVVAGPVTDQVSVPSLAVLENIRVQAEPPFLEI